MSEPSKIDFRLALRAALRLPASTVTAIVRSVDASDGDFVDGVAVILIEADGGYDERYAALIELGCSEEIARSVCAAESARRIAAVVKDPVGALDASQLELFTAGDMKSYRTRVDISQDEAARRCMALTGVTMSQTTWQKMESGAKPVSDAVKRFLTEERARLQASTASGK